ncbi:superoxide dismutase, Ni [Candidatus Microgenomates bacterium]|nr:superoxide dismutase, Ni [Candidatus Microgenomates bacterium]
MLIDRLIKILPTKPIFAHCDIPCGIYDPHEMQMAAHTILRMVNLINEAKDDPHKVTRCIKVKEEHAQKVEHEVVTLWADYFKEEHLKDYPNLHDLVWKTLKLTGKVRQEVNLEAAQELLKNVQEIAEIFWKTKGMEPARIPSGYPTEGEIVSHS